MAAASTDEYESEWLKHVKKSLKEEEIEMSSDKRMFTIAHPFWRLFKPQAYTPQVISIGPYHHRKLQQYEETNTYKLKMARALETELPGFKFSTLVKMIESKEKLIRACYHKHIPYSTEGLSWMLALDISFILQLLKSICGPDTPDRVETDSSLKRSYPYLDSKRKTPFWYAITNDILMLENQVPMFLLVEAFWLTSANRGNKSSGLPLERSKSQGDSRNQDNIRLQRVGSSSQQDKSKSEEELRLAKMLKVACLHFSPFDREEICHPYKFLINKRHVLEFLYHYVIGPSNKLKQSVSKASGTSFSFFQKKPLKKIDEDATGDGNLQPATDATAADLRSATELSEAGIRFAPYLSGDLSEISFEEKTSTFLLPKITINASTEVTLRNLVALELNLEPSEKPLTRYIYLMDRLIDTERDVAILKRCGVVNSQMSSDAEVAQMWNSMRISIGVHKFDPVDKAMKEANKSYKSKHGKVLLTEFQKTYCSKPWLIASVLSAGILLLLTLIQVLCLFFPCNKW